MSTLYSRVSSWVPAPSSLPFASRIARLHEALARSHDLGDARLASSSAAGSDLPAPPEMRAMESGIGPWSFALSGYAVALLAMAVALNRMQNIVRPAPPSAVIEQMARQRLREARRAARSGRGQASGWRKTWRNVRDAAVLAGQRAVTSDQALVALRLPAIALILSALWKLTLVLLQTGPASPPEFLVHTAAYGKVLRQPMEDLLWSSFLSVCAVIACNAFINGIKGSSRGSSFNLFGFAFLLHLYSSPLTHVGVPSRDVYRLGKSAGIETRPDWNVTFGIWLAVLELAWLQTSELSEKWARRRLIPTGVCGVIGLVHFTGTLLYNPTRLPSFTFLTSLLSLALLLVIVLTVALNMLTQMFTVGEIDPGQLLPHSSSWPSQGDDWSVALLRLAAACLESSTVGGMGNEVACVRAPKTAFVDLSSRSIAIGDQPSAPRSGFANHVRDVRAHEGSVSREGASQIFPQLPFLSAGARDRPFWRELKSFGAVLVRWLQGAAWAALGLVPGGRWTWALGSRTGEWVARVRIGRRGFYLLAPLAPREYAERALRDVVEWEVDEDEDEDDGLQPRELYARFLAGDAADDGAEEDDPTFEWSPARHRQRRARSSSLASSASSSSSGCDELPSDADDDDDDDEPDAPMATYSDLPPSPTLPPVLLAHMTSTAPLTRARYRGLIAPAAPAAAPDTVSAIRQRRASLSGAHAPPGLGAGGAIDDVAGEDDEDEATVAPCVVCYSQRREILLIPCLCLALCSDCRAHMAVKAADCCPCCRTKVTGYSRIFIP